MPQEIRDLFKKSKGGAQKHIRLRNGVYEIRVRFHGVDISASSKNKKIAKEKFFQKLKELDDGAAPVPTTFSAFAMFYFENFRKRKVSPETYKSDLYRFREHLQPYFGEKPLKSITPFSIQKFLDGIIDSGRGRTAEECYSLLNCTFKMAIAHKVLNDNPLSIVYLEKHERKSGSALTHEEEKILLQRSGALKKVFAFALYTGLRPNEYRTARIEGRMIIAVNSKRKNKKTEYKRIPISPMLAPYLNDGTELIFPTANHMRNKLHEIFPNHKLYDLRTTFYTRCKECAIGDAARDEMMGHSLGKLGNAYTDLSDEYLFREIEKFLY